MTDKSTFETDKAHQSKPLFPTFRALPSALLRKARGVKRCWKRSWHYLLGFAIILVFVYAALDIYATAQLNQQLHLIRAQGAPLTLAEAAPPPVSDSQNATIWYDRAVKALQYEGKGVPPTLPHDKARAFLAKNQKALELIKETTTKPQYRLHTDWNDPLHAVYPEFAQMRNLARLLSMKAQYEAEQGNTQAALECIQQQLAMAKHLTQTPVLIGALVARALEGIANGTLAKVLFISNIDAKQASEFKKSLVDIDWPPVLYRALQGERAFVIQAYQGDWNWDAYAYKSLPRPIDKTLRFIWKPFRKLDETYSLTVWQKFLKDIQNTPVPLPMNYMSKMDKQISQAPWYARTARLTLPAFTGQRHIIDMAEVERRQREIALALAVYHSQYHQYPATLDDVKPIGKSTFPIDPYSGKPFHYRRDGDSYILYSIGTNRKDDKGVNNAHGPAPRILKDDIIWKN